MNSADQRSCGTSPLSETNLLNPQPVAAPLSPVVESVVFLRDDILSGGVVMDRNFAHAKLSEEPDKTVRP